MHPDMGREEVDYSEDYSAGSECDEWSADRAAPGRSHRHKAVKPSCQHALTQALQSL